MVFDPQRPHGLQSSVHGIFQARVLEWGAIAFSVATTYTWFIYILLSVMSRLETMLRIWEDVLYC